MCSPYFIVEYVPDFVELKSGGPKNSLGKLLFKKQILRKEPPRRKYITSEKKRLKKREKKRRGIIEVSNSIR